MIENIKRNDLYLKKVILNQTGYRFVLSITAGVQTAKYFQVGLAALLVQEEKEVLRLSDIFQKSVRVNRVFQKKY